MIPFLYSLLLRFTSAVCGNEPMVVVGSKGSERALFCIFARSLLFGSLVKSDSFKLLTAFWTDVSSNALFHPAVSPEFALKTGLP